MERKIIVRRSLIGFLLVLTLLWVWREAMGLPVAIDGMLACLGLPAALVLFAIPNDGTTTRSPAGIGSCLLMGIAGVVMLVTLVSRMNRIGSMYGPLPERIVFCFLSWAGLLLALIFISSLEGDGGKNSPADGAAPPTT